MFKHIFSYNFKLVLRDKITLFWIFVFPLILATFFNFAFSNLSNINGFETIDIGIVKNNDESNNNFIAVLNEVSIDDQKMFNIKDVSLEEAKEELTKNSIKAYIILDKEMVLNINKNGIEQTIIKTVMDNYIQNMSTIEQIMKIDMEKAMNIIKDGIDFNSYISSGLNSKTDFTVIYFYSLVGMVALYSGMFGVKIVTNLNPNLSQVGIRNSLSPVSKFKLFYPSFLIMGIIQSMLIILTILYLNLLGVDFNNRILLAIIIGILGSLVGIMFGAVIGVLFKYSENVKVGIIVVSTMILSFLAGLMVVDMKYIINDKFPLLAKINPVNLITDGMYSLYFYDNLNRFYQNIIYLFIMLFIFSGIVIFKIRRNAYENI